jgi:hypothetical protein
MPRTATLLLISGLLLAGCTGAPLPGQGGPTATETPTSDPTDTPTQTPTDPPTATPTPDGPGPTPTPYPPGQAPDPSHEVTIDNRLDGEATVRVRIIREATNETVFDDSVALYGERTVYDTAEAGPEGGESFQIVAERGGDTATVTIQMTECYGDVIISPTEDGGVDATYSIC